jgi:hypothetical protein
MRENTLHLQICDEYIPPSCTMCVDLKGGCLVDGVHHHDQRETAADHTTSCLRYMINLKKLGFEEEEENEGNG